MDEGRIPSAFACETKPTWGDVRTDYHEMKTIWTDEKCETEREEIVFLVD
jgi:hypothetical protein